MHVIVIDEVIDAFEVVRSPHLEFCAAFTHVGAGLINDLGYFRVLPFELHPLPGVHVLVGDIAFLQGHGIGGIHGVLPLAHGITAETGEFRDGPKDTPPTRLWGIQHARGPERQYSICHHVF